MIGLSLGMLDCPDLQTAADIFRRLQERFPLGACEIQGETTLFPSALAPWDPDSVAVGRQVRKCVSKLGLHLPFIDLNPVSGHPRIAGMSLDVLEQALDAAAEIEADFVVFHGRGQRYSGEWKDERPAWGEVLSLLGRMARERSLIFCLENADDLRRLSVVNELAGAAGVGICLDTGHLYERIYDDSAWGLARRAAARLQDILSPRPFLLKTHLPAAELGDIDDLAGFMGEKVACLHLHNHDGRRAHRPLREGTVPWRRLANHPRFPQGIPLILEADYRGRARCELEADLGLLASLKGAEGGS